MKLKKYQQGGGLIYTPFIPEDTASTGYSSSSKSSGDDDSKLDPLDKELLSLMKDQNLLPSDVNQIFTRLIAFQKKSQSLSTLGDDSYRSVMPGMLQIMQMVSNARYNKAKSDDAIRIMSNQNTGADVALDSYGRMYVQNADGEIKHIFPKEFDASKHRPISNSELLYLRENSLPFDTDILSDISQTVGLTEISKEISRIIKDFGTTQSEGYYDKDLVKAFAALNSPDGIYKLTEEGVSRDVLNRAWHVIYKQLPTKMQHVLDARAAISGVGYENFIEDIVLSYVDYKQSINYDAQQSKAAGYETDPLGAKKESTEQLTQNNYLQQIGNRRLYRSEAAIVPIAAQISDTGALIVPVYNAGMPVDKQMDGIGMMTLSNFRVKAEASKAGDFSSVTFGNKILRDNEFDQIVYDGVSELNIAMLPYKHDPTTRQIMPDFDKLIAFNYIQGLIDKNPNISETELAQKARDKGYDLTQLGYDRKTNSINLLDTMPFITFSAYANKDSLDIPKSARPFLEHLSNADGKQIMNKIETLINYGELTPTKNSRKLNDFNTPERWDLYHGNVYVPMTNAARAMLLSGIGEFVPKSDMSNYAARVTAREVESAMTNYLQQADPNYNQISQLAQFK